MSFLKKLFGIESADYSNIHLVDSLEFRSRIANKKVQLIDVRTPNEYHQGKLKGALNIDYYSKNFTDALNSLERDRPVFLYCKSGVRSRRTAKKLAKLGFEEIYDLKGGITRWKITES